MELPINQILHGDCLEVMKGLPDGSIDLVVTSPPYDNLRTYDGFTFDFENIARQLFRIVKDGGVVVWVVSDATIDGSETGTSFRQALFFKEIGFNLHDTMIYAKNNYVPLTHNRYEQQFEYMFCFSKGKPSCFNPMRRKNEYAGIRKGGTMRRQDGVSVYKNKDDITTEESIKPNIFFYNIGSGSSTKNPIAFEHPAIFPEHLAVDQIRTWSNANDLILDPMCGSGTTCVAAKMEGRKYIGIEISEKYCKIAKERIASAPTPLFVN